jgi:hypothetical protein
MQIQLAWLSFRVIIDPVLILELENATRHLRSVVVFLEAVPSIADPCKNCWIVAFRRPESRHGYKLIPS